MTDERPEHRDARCCPDCGARGILPLEQPHTPDGGIQDPVMICPVCETEFRAAGVTWLGAFRPPDATLPAEEQDAEVREIVRTMGRRTRNARGE